MARTTSDPAVDALAKVDLFRDLTRRELAAIAAACRRHTFREGQLIVGAGDGSQRFFLVESGEADVELEGRHLRRLGAGDYFGEMAVIDQGERSADVRAVTDVTAISLAPFAFRPLLKEQPQICYKLLVQMCRRVREAQGSG